MCNMNSLQAKCFTMLFSASFTLFLILLGITGSPVEGELTRYVKNFSSSLNCNPVEYAMQDVVFLETNVLFLKTENTTVHSTAYRKEGEKILVCSPYNHVSNLETVLNCTLKSLHESHEFQILPNRSAIVHGMIFAPEEYELSGKELFTCAQTFGYDYDIYGNDTTEIVTISEASIKAGIIGSAISIIALIIHLVIFCFVPTLRNLPGYNLGSLSVTFLLGYSFFLIGQIPEVLGLFCVISAVLQLNFFLAAFFCMNVLAFDVWRTMKLATENLAVRSQNTRKSQFIWYSLYAWGCPLLISSISVIIDNSGSFPDSIKPYYGRNGICWFTNKKAKLAFFVAPEFTLLVINGIFFFWSSWMISSNTMKCKNDHSKKTVQLNYILYVRLGVMMGLTWLLGVIALICNSEGVWFVFILVNSLQGLFLVLLFTSTKKVIRHLRRGTSTSHTEFQMKTETLIESQ